MAKVKLCIVAVIAALGLMAVDNAKDLQKVRTRVVARDAATIPGKIIYTYVRGTETWQITNTIKRIAITPTPTRYSKLKLIQAAKEVGKWDAVKSFISAANLTDEWQACQYIEEGNPAYVAATNQVITSGIATEEQVKAFMLKAIDSEL